MIADKAVKALSISGKDILASLVATTETQTIAEHLLFFLYPSRRKQISLEATLTSTTTIQGKANKRNSLLSVLDSIRWIYDSYYDNRLGNLCSPPLVPLVPFRPLSPTSSTLEKISRFARACDGCRYLRMLIERSCGGARGFVPLHVFARSWTARAVFLERRRPGATMTEFSAGILDLRCTVSLQPCTKIIDAPLSKFLDVKFQIKRIVTGEQLESSIAPAEWFLYFESSSEYFLSKL